MKKVVIIEAIVLSLIMVLLFSACQKEKGKVEAPNKVPFVLKSLPEKAPEVKSLKGEKPKINKNIKVTTRYICPSRCEGNKTYPYPGKCPICGKDLVPVEKVKAKIKVKPLKKLESPLKPIERKLK